MPAPVSVAGKLVAWIPVCGLLFLLALALFCRHRHRVEGPITLARVLATVNILAVAVLMAQTSGFVALALHGHTAIRNSVTQHERASRQVGNR